MEVRCGAGKRRRSSVVVVIPHACATVGVALALLCATAPGVRAAAETDIAIHATAASFRVGTDGLYHLSVSNGGDVDTDAPVRVTSTLPAGLGFVSGGGGGWTCTGAERSLECTIPGIAAGTTIAFSIIVDICTTAGSVTTAFGVAYDGDINGANDTTQRTTSVKAGQCSSRQATPTLPPGVPTNTPTVAGAPSPTRTPTPVSTDLQLTTTSAGSFTIGTQPTYFHVVTNVGSGTTNVPMVLVDTLPVGIGFVSADGTGWLCSASGRTVTCTNPQPLAAGTAAALTLTVSVGPDAYPSVTNLATLVYPAELDESDNSARRPTTIRRPRPVRGRPVPRGTPTAAPSNAPPGATATRTPTRTPSPRPVLPTDLMLTKTSAGVFNVGRPGVYVLRVSNVGKFATEAPITLTDTLPSSLSFISISGGGWDCTVNGQTVQCVNPNPLAPGALSILHLSVNVSSAAFPGVLNMASISYPNDTNPRNNAARRPATVRR